MPMSRTEKLSHYAVVFIAVSAVVVSIWQVRLSHIHNKLTVRPFMDHFSGWSSMNEWELTLTNEGVGPAILKSMEFRYDGNTYKNWDELLKVANLSDIRLDSYTFTPDSPFAVGKTVTFLKLHRPEDSLTAHLGIHVKIKYESVYEEPFVEDITF